MPRLSEIAPGRFINAADLSQPEVVVVDSITSEEMFNPVTNQKVVKEVMWFRGHTKGLIIGAERRDDLIDIFGDVDWGDLTGKSVELLPVEQKGKQVIRIRAPQDTPAPKVQQSAAQTGTVPTLNPAQATFVRDVRTILSNATDDERKTAIAEAVATLGADYLGTDWRELAPTQLGAVLEALRTKNDADNLNGIPF